MVHQHFMLVDNFTVLENLVLGAEKGFWVRETLAGARKTLERIERDYAVNPATSTQERARSCVSVARSFDRSFK